MWFIVLLIIIDFAKGVYYGGCDFHGYYIHGSMLYCTIVYTIELWTLYLTVGFYCISGIFSLFDKDKD